MTITNANFDSGALERQIGKMLILRDGLKKTDGSYYDAAVFMVSGRPPC
jgi:hypothetical protein